MLLRNLLTARTEPHLQVLNIHIWVDTAELLWPFNSLNVSFISLSKERSYCNALFTSITHRNLLSINDYEKVAGEYLNALFFWSSCSPPCLKVSRFKDTDSKHCSCLQLLQKTMWKIQITELHSITAFSPHCDTAKWMTPLREFFREYIQNAN